MQRFRWFNLFLNRWVVLLAMLAVAAVFFATPAPPRAQAALTLVVNSTGDTV